MLRRLDDFVPADAPDPGTDPLHEREVLETEGVDVDIVVMIQGDEPLIRPEMVWKPESRATLDLAVRDPSAVTVRMPFPPPPAEGLTSSGKPISAA